MDGTLVKHGHTSQFGAVAVILCETGEILDFEIMSKYCEKCKTCKAKHTTIGISRVVGNAQRFK